MPDDPAAREALARSCLLWARKLAGSFVRTGRDADRDDYESAAMFGLARAARDFDPSRGFRFITFAHKYILRELANERRRRGRKAEQAVTFTDFESADGSPFDPMDPATDPAEARSRRDDAEAAALADLCESRLLALTPDPPDCRLGGHVRPGTRSTPRHHELVAVCRAALELARRPA